jgi:uracil-DNA glycosylase family 4
VYTSKSVEKKESMNLLAAEARSCLGCDLANNRKKVVIGSGCLDADVVLIGEAPGKKEDEKGLPFVGSAGKVLNEILDKAGISRNEVFITNILKCRPPGNRRPKKAEIESCEGILISQLEIIKPRIIAPMGNSSVSYFQDKYDLEVGSIGDVHGKVYEVNTSWGEVKLIPLYHPAAAIYRKNLLEELEEDMMKLSKL